MRYNDEARRCVAVIGSITECMRAGSLLAHSYIATEIIKADLSRGQKGCMYGLEYDSNQDKEVRDVLARAGIRPQRFYTGGRR